jgi:threonine synthase
MATPWRGVIAEYADRLPVTAGHLSELTGCDVRLKIEGQNPTGSFKDRGMTVAISKALEEGATAVICASTGNTSASAAAYAVKAGIDCVVLVPHGRIAAGKLAQALVHDARLLQVEGGFDDCLRLARELADQLPVSLVNSVNAFRIEGQKTAAFEVVDVLGRAPDVHALPVGNAGNVTAYWRGYVEYAGDGRCDRPRMWGFQAEGAAPIVHGERVASPETVATAIRIGDPASWAGAVAARDESGGRIDAVSDRAILDAQRLLAAREGVFVEPASAASVAGLLQCHRQGLLDPGQLVVCTLTGNGLKDTETALRELEISTDTVPADVRAAAEVLGLLPA